MSLTNWLCSRSPFFVSISPLNTWVRLLWSIKSAIAHEGCTKPTAKRGKSLSLLLHPLLLPPSSSLALTSLALSPGSGFPPLC